MNKKDEQFNTVEKALNFVHSKEFKKDAMNQALQIGNHAPSTMGQTHRLVALINHHLRDSKYTAIKSLLTLRVKGMSYEQLSTMFKVHIELIKQLESDGKKIMQDRMQKSGLVVQI